jgi:(p)ppGpp synthase/HD superfamily hydrolase
MRSATISPRLEQALRWAAECHQGQSRRGVGTPYFEHVAAVALVLDRAGFDEDIVIAGLLHDIVEDTAETLSDVASRFGPAVAEIVGHCSEQKFDAQGRKPPWIERKRDHLAALAAAPAAAKAVILADKLHNLISIKLDLDEGRDIWSEFHAEPRQVLSYYHAAIEACGHGDPRIQELARSCHDALARVSASV